MESKENKDRVDIIPRVDLKAINLKNIKRMNFDEHFKLFEKLGEGGFGDVYRV